jgi:ligand-binding sensor domain-containing protein
MEVMRRKLGTSTIYGISDAGNGAYWMGVADNAFVLYDSADRSITRYNEISGFEGLTSISAAFAIRKRGVTEEICFGTYSEGLWLYDPNAGKVKVFSTQTHPVMLNNSILSLENDTCGNLWIGTHAGAYILTPSDELMTLHDFLPCDETAQLNDQIHGLAASADGRMFLATLQNGIVEVDVRSKEVQCHMTSGKQIPFSNILVDRDGHVWAGTLTDGLYVLDIETGNLRKADLVRGLESQCITNLMQSADGEIWVATQGDGAYVRRNDGTWEKITFKINADLTDKWIEDIEEAPDGSKWLVSPFNVWHCDSVKMRMSSLKGKEEASDPCILIDGACDEDGNLYVASICGVQLVSRETGEQKVLDFLPVASYFSVCFDKQGFLWCDGTAGIYRVNLKKQTFRRIPLPAEKYLPMTAKNFLRLFCRFVLNFGCEKCVEWLPPWKKIPNCVMLRIYKQMKLFYLCRSYIVEVACISVI